MLKKVAFVSMILTLCLTPLTGCDRDSTPSPSPPIPSSGNSSQEPIHLDIGGDICHVTVDATYDAEKKQDFVMNIDCNDRELFFIEIDGSNPLTGISDGVDVDIFGKDFLNWGTLK